MTVTELKSKLNSEHLYTGALKVVYQKQDIPNVIGVFERDGTWYLYDTNERGNAFILDSGTEETIVDALYRRIIKKHNWLANR